MMSKMKVGGLLPIVADDENAEGEAGDSASEVRAPLPRCPARAQRLC
jgi:hypothetical protein